MSVENSFEGRHDDYAFFLTHSDEPTRCRDAVVRELEVWREAEPHRPIRLMDFGCSRGEFLRGVLERGRLDPGSLALTLVDVDVSALEAARREVAAFSTVRIDADVAPPGGREFDVILSNHVLYYVPDLAQTLRRLMNAVADGGLALLTLGGRDNQLCRLWQHVFDAVGEPVPFYLAPDVERELSEIPVRFTKSEIRSVLEFDDTAENRARIARFVFGPHFQRFGPERILPHFDAWSADGRIVMENRDVCFCVIAPTA